MLRKSSPSPPATCNCVQVFPRSTERRITPFEPEAHTARLSGSCKYAALTPRRFVSNPLVCTDHQEPLLFEARTKIVAVRATTNKVRNGVGRCRTQRILAAVLREG